MIFGKLQKSIVIHQRAISRSAIAAIIDLAFLLVLSPTSIQACSDFMLPKYGDSPTIDNPAVSVRTMDFNASSFSYFWACPRNWAWHSFVGWNPGNRNGMKWESKYAFVAVNIGGRSFWGATDDLFIDGMNEKGLSVCTLWLDTAKTPTPTKAQQSKCVNQLQIVAYLLGNCSTVDDIIKIFDKDLPDVYVVEVEPMGFISAPAHVCAHDNSNNSVVLEWVSDKTFRPNIYSFKTDPTYCNSITNDELPNEIKQLNENPVYRLLSPTNPYNYIADHYNVGGGEVGLPGDSGDFSRWLRGYYLMPNAWPSNPYSDSCQVPWRVIQALNAMGRNDRLYGEGMESPEPPILSWYSFTEWTLARDHTNLMFYYSCMRNQQVKQLDLSKYFDEKKLHSICPLASSYKPAVEETSTTSSIRSKHGSILEFDVSVPEKLKGKEGDVYVYARLKDGRYVMWNGTEWTLSQTPTQCPPCLRSTLAQAQIHMRITLDDGVADWSDASLYAGCGESLADMFINKTYSKINIGE